MNKLKAYLRLARVEHGLMTGLAVMAGYLAVTWSFSWRLALAFLSSFFAEVTLFAFNDVFNIEEDRVNSPERPLVRGDLSKREALVFAASSSLLALLLAAPLGFYPVLLLSIALALGNMYNYYLKRFSLLGNIVVAGLTASSFLYGSLTTGLEIPEKVVLFFVVAFLANTGREIIKGIRDIEGDIRAGICTLACQLGVRQAGFISAVYMALAVLLSFASIRYFTLKAVFAPMLAITDAIFLHAIYSILRDPAPEVAGKLRKTTLLGMLVAIVAFTLP
ncbi:UbiA family prenyltransferase [Infirmifilum lucidum]|uniref:UbiA family prenyltransferase n=1 Tax=Infirmifilum lucidum TaxID=2776706 RepID=A0A7L9FIJ6_9CREN|nr:UbiA family prenyltransferase [Infirmifilum lucidum]QOJ79610.1 UbiA family prenyltransferase [Infirmifilum lucidum]